MNELKNLIEKANYIVVMTGAGMSVPSGIPDFRSSGGLYDTKAEISPEEILSHTFFVNSTDKFYEFYKTKMIYQDALPNIGHKTLAKLEEMNKIKAIVTQNIDGLHQTAGSKEVIELHGTVHRNYCQKCSKLYDLNYIIKADLVPKCECGGIIKPDVVLYEEALPKGAIEKALMHIRKADLLIVVGTSLLVHPAASLIHYFRGNHLVIINKGKTPYDRYADLVINEPLEKILTDELIRKD